MDGRRGLLVRVVAGLVGLVAAVFAVTVAGVVSVGASGGTVWVDDDWAVLALGDDPPGPATEFGVDGFATVTDALAVSPDRVEVAAGTYVEQVVVSGAVEVVGAGVGVSVIRAPAVMVAHGGVRAIVTVDGGDLTLSGVTVSGPAQNLSNPVEFGVTVTGGGALVASGVEVLDVRDNPISGNQTGRAFGVGTPGGGVGSAVLDGVVARRYQKNGVHTYPGTWVEVRNSTFVGEGPAGIANQNGIIVQGAGVVEGNTVTTHEDFVGTAPIGVGVLNPSGSVRVEGNTLVDNEYGVYVSTTGGFAGEVLVTGNEIDATELATGWGVLVVGAGDGVVVRAQPVTDADVGIYVAGAGARVVSNPISGLPFGFGLAVTPLEFAANRIVGNTVGVSGLAAVSGGPNWWGCNEGPGQPGCDTVSGSYTEPEWLVLGVDLPECEVEEGDVLPVEVRLDLTSGGGEYLTSTVPPTPVSTVGAAGGSISPASGVTAGGRLAAVFTAGTPGLGEVTAEADAAATSSADDACVGGITITAAPPTTTTTAPPQPPPPPPSTSTTTVPGSTSTTTVTPLPTLVPDPTTTTVPGSVPSTTEVTVPAEATTSTTAGDGGGVGGDDQSQGGEMLPVTGRPVGWWAAVAVTLIWAGGWAAVIARRLRGPAAEYPTREQ